LLKILICIHICILQIFIATTYIHICIANSMHICIFTKLYIDTSNTLIYIYSYFTMHFIVCTYAYKIYTIILLCKLQLAITYSLLSLHIYLLFDMTQIYSITILQQDIGNFQATVYLCMYIAIATYVTTCVCTMDIYTHIICINIIGILAA